jgi:hypothetical protein
MKTLTITSEKLRKGLNWISQVLLVFMVFACNNGGEEGNPSCEELGNCPPTAEFNYLDVSAEASDVVETKNIKYGSNNAYNLVNVFEVPENEDMVRPLILLSPGGGFALFNRMDEIEDMATDLARRGYVVGVVRYNIDPNMDFTDNIAIQRKWLEGIIDQKTAVRYFKSMAAEYRIDPAKIYLGGWSNGGQLALNAATLQSSELATIANEGIRTSVTALVDEMGGMEGSEYPSVNSDVRGALLLNVYSFDLNSIDVNDPAMMFIHHTESRISSMKSILTLGTFSIGNDTFYGPQPLTERAKSVGFTEGADLDLITMTGEGYISTLSEVSYHEPNYAALSPTNYNAIAAFFHRNMQ